MARNKKTRNEGDEDFINSLEMGMLNKTDFNDEELESYLTQGVSGQLRPACRYL